MLDIRCEGVVSDVQRRQVSQGTEHQNFYAAARNSASRNEIRLVGEIPGHRMMPPYEHHFPTAPTHVGQGRVHPRGSRDPEVSITLPEVSLARPLRRCSHVSFPYLFVLSAFSCRRVATLFHRSLARA
eukprot:757768-Hanusia_phi.AAC.1